MIKRCIRSFSSTLFLFAILSLLIASVALSGKWNSARAASVITWNGGGTTNNWSEGANWSSNTVPGPGDIVTFNSTSTKDVTIDTNINISAITIDTGYTGTITQTDAAAIIVSGCFGRACIVQNSGTFNGSRNTITLNGSGLGAVSMNGGVFNGGAGDITVFEVPNQTMDVSVQGGTFKSTSGKLILPNTLNVGGGSFVHNSGTLEMVGDQNAVLNIAAGNIFNNVTINKSNADILGSGSIVVAGSLSLNDGSISGGTFEARGGVSVSPNFDGGGATLAIANGVGPRNVIFSTGINLPKVQINDPNVTVDTSGTGTLLFPRQLVLNQGVFNQNTADLVIKTADGVGGICLQQTGGTFNGSAKSITLSGAPTGSDFDAYQMSGGNFNGGSGDIAVLEVPNQFTNIDLQGGTFKSTSGTLTTPYGFNIAGSSFVNNSGTVDLGGDITALITTGPADIFNNVTVNKLGAALGIANRVVVQGTLSLSNGSIINNGHTVEVRGSLSVAPAFNGGDAILELANGSGPRNITLSTGLNLPRLKINDPNLTVDTSGTGTLHFPHQLELDQGVFDQDEVDLLFEAQGVAGTGLLENGGVFNASANTITVNPNGFGSVLINGGVFNGGSGSINLIGATDGGTSLNVQGGTFKSTSGTLTMTDTLLLTQGTAFLNNSGTVNFTAAHGAFIQSGGVVTFNNVLINLTNTGSLSVGPSMITLGELDLNSGVLNASNPVEAHGTTVVGPNFAGGIANFTFGGSNNQTFTNNGGVNFSGTWTINKPIGTVTTATGIILANTQVFNITSGTLFLANGSAFTVGALTVGDAGKLINDSSTTITLGGNVSNAGIIDLEGSGAGCPDPDTILLRSSAAGTQRTWTKANSGIFRLVDVDVRDQAGTAAITVFSGTNSGNNGANFTFNSNCPPNLSISPAVASAVTGAHVTFTAGGGTGTRAFSIPANNSGGTITSSGFYTAGIVPDVTDTVRVTDSLGQTADATVNVTGPASKLGFTVQPASTTAGQSIAPAIQVTVEDANGVAVIGATDGITLAIANNAGGGRLSGSTFHNAVLGTGTATFDGLSINKSGTGYTLRATASGLTQAISASFNINPASAAKLVFTAQPQDASITSVIKPPVQVAVQDAFSNLVSTANNPITIGIGNNPGSSTITGTNPKSAVNGVATFSDLNLNNPGNGYTLTASATSLTSATSSAFNVSSPFVVTNTNDSGPGSLRDAINNANSSAGVQTIGFNIPGSGPFVISPQTALPIINSSVNLDGTTEPGFAGSPLVQLDGSNIPNFPALDLRADSSTIRGLSIVKFAFAIQVRGSGNSLAENWIGISASNMPTGNVEGIVVFQGSQNVIGGPNAADRNIISGNGGVGVAINSSANTIQGNFIGTDVSGTTAIGNNVGVDLEFNAISNVIKDNVISGNLFEGVLIGTSGNDHDNVVQNNSIGLDVTGALPIGNGAAGIHIGDFGTNDRLTQNRIFANKTLGILLGLRPISAAGPPLPNDPEDVDTGANLKQNYPLIGSLNVQTSSLGVSGQLNSTPSANFTLEFFSSPSCDASGNGEGSKFLGTGNVTTGTTGFGSFNFTFPVSVGTSEFITATATDANGNTSEFSPCKGSQFSIQGTVSDSLAGNTPIAGAAVKLHNSTTTIDTLLSTDSTGHFGPLEFPQGQTVTVSSSKPNFQQLSESTTNIGGDEQVFISMGQVAATISGHITLNGSSLGGVNMTLSGGSNATTTTDSSGNYSFANLVTSGTSYTVTPSLQNFTFSPTSVTTSLNSDQTANFAATNLLANLPGRIVFESNGNINTMNANGTGLATIFTSVSNLPFAGNPTPSALPAGSGSETTFAEPNFSNDGAKIAFYDDLTSVTNSSTTTTVSLQTSASDGSGSVNVIGSGAGSLGRISFSPDRTKLASDRLVNGVRQLVTIKASDGSIAPLVTTGSKNTDPDWSPDGTKLVFARDDLTTPGNKTAVFVVDATGSNLVKRTTPTFSDSSPRWSPDGAKIAFLRSTSTGGPTQIVVMSTSTFVLSIIYTTPAAQIFDLHWAPDSSRLALLEGSTGSSSIVSILPDGTNKLVITTHVNGSTFDWGPTPLVITPIGNNINLNIGNLNLGFTGITGFQAPSFDAGSQPTIEAELISPASVGTPPADYVPGDIAYQITTTAAFTPPVTVCIDVPADQYPTAASFNEASLLHDEGGTLIDVTTSRDFGLHRVCGQVTTLGNFLIADHINNALPRLSGLVVDQDGNPLDDLTVSLSGDATEQSTTGFDGAFSFVNLTDGGSYLVTPTSVGYTFSAPFQGYDSLSGEQTVVFVATPASFSITGTILDGNLMPQDHVTVTLSGTADAEVVTGADGTYSFDNLPANGTYFVTASLTGTSFSPPQLSVIALQNDLVGADFIGLLPTAAPVSISGRATRSDGYGIGSARLTLISSSGDTQTTLTNAFGYYHFDGIEAGGTYVLSISSKSYQFTNPTRVINLTEAVSDADFTAVP